jgi:hypothetical protein
MKSDSAQMPILDQWEITLSVDDVLRAQAADADEIRKRRPSLIKITEQAINKGKYLIKPIVLYEIYPVKSFVHERLDLVANPSNPVNPHLSGSLIAQHLAGAQQVIVMLCTIGRELDETVSSLFRSDPLGAIALDGMGSAAVENLGIQACNYFEAQANTDGFNTSMPLNPGMVGWPVEEGQLQIFTLLDSEKIHVSLTESCMMVPNKSLSMVLGIGKELSSMGSSCDYCSLKGVCKYQNHYAK